jgi:predicted transcriptional regulator
MPRRPHAPPPLHELESAVMGELWERGGGTVREVMDALNRGRGKRRAYTTYMTSMARLHKKGLLHRRREGKTDVYSPVFGREEYASLRAEAEVEGLVAEYGDAALSHFARQIASLDPARRRALEQLARDDN